MPTIQDKKVVFAPLEKTPQVGSEAYKQAQSGILPTGSYEAPSIQSSPDPINTTISSDKIGTTKKLIVPPPVNDTTANTNLGITNAVQTGKAVADVAQAQKDATVTQNTTVPNDKASITDKLRSLIGIQGEKAQFTADVQKEQGYAEKTKALNDINNKITLTTQSYDNKIKEIRKNSQGLFGNALESAVSDLEMKKNQDLANLAITKSVALNDLNTANDIIDKKVATKFEPIDNQIKSYQNLYTLLQNDLSESEKVTVEANLANRKLEKNIQIDMYKGANDALAKGGASETVFKQVEDAFNSGNIPKMWSLVAPYAKKAVASTNNITSDNERALLSQFNSSPIVKDYNAIVAQKLTTDNIIKNGVGGPADLALIYTFMKGLDPNSVVRETEYATAAKSGNIFSGALAKFNGYFKETGGFLPKNVQSEFKNLVNQKLLSQQQQYDNFATNYRNIAVRQGLNPDNVVVNYGGALTSGEPTNTGNNTNTNTSQPTTKQDPTEFRNKYGY